MSTEPSLFAAARDGDLPLAHRMRPKTPEEFLGQEHLVGPEFVSSVAGLENAKCQTLQGQTDTVTDTVAAMLRSIHTDASATEQWFRQLGVN